MSQLSDVSLRSAMLRGHLSITPWTDSLAQPASIEVTLGTSWLLPDDEQHTVDLVKRDAQFRPVNRDRITLQPGSFALAATAETITLDGTLAAKFEGKALALNTEIPTPTGWTTMGDVKPGEMVLGRKGGPVRVVNATDVMRNRDCYRVAFSDGREVIADAQHQWVVQQRCNAGFQRDEILTTAQMAESVTYGSMKLSRYRIPAVTMNGERLGLPIDPYVLGVWLGDGTSSSSAVTLNRRDAQEITSEVMRRGVRAEWNMDKGGASAYRLGGTDERKRDTLGRWASDESLQSTLGREGLLGNKHIPTAYLRSAFGQRWDLMMGLLDTDGYVNKRGDQAELTFTNERLASDAAELIQSLGIITTTDERPAKIDGREVGTAYRLRFRPVPEMFNTGFRARRARDTNVWAAGVLHGHRMIRKIERIPDVAVRCIEVDGGEFLITRSFILTHNSSLGRMGAMTHVTAGFIDPGFSGQITLEAYNVSPWALTFHAGMAIGQLVFTWLDQPCSEPYGADRWRSHYFDQQGATGARA